MDVLHKIREEIVFSLCPWPSDLNIQVGCEKHLNPSLLAFKNKLKTEPMYVT